MEKNIKDFSQFDIPQDIIEKTFEKTYSQQFRSEDIIKSFQKKQHQSYQSQSNKCKQSNKDQSFKNLETIEHNQYFHQDIESQGKVDTKQFELKDNPQNESIFYSESGSQNNLSQIQHLQCQIIEPNEQLKDKVKIFYKFCPLKQKFDEIFKDLSNNQKRDVCDCYMIEEFEEYEQEEELKILKQKRTIQQVYNNDKNTVIVKTRISQKQDIFVTQKIIFQKENEPFDTFKSKTEKEVKIIKKLQNSKVTIPLIWSKIQPVKDTNLHSFYIQMVSGMKSLHQIKLYYQMSKKYDEYVILLEYAFFQLLFKLNVMHHDYQIAHSDIKPLNIIMGYDYDFYFIDFGGSIYLEDKKECKNYLSTYTRYFNYEQVFQMQKCDKDWTAQRIVDCDTIQLILTFLYMLDVEDKEYVNLRVRGNTENFLKILEPEFKEFAELLTKQFDFIIQKKKNKMIPFPQCQVNLIYNYNNILKEIMSDQKDIVYMEDSDLYELKFINKFSIQIIELIIKSDPNCQFRMTDKTLVEECLNFGSEQFFDKRNLILFPHFCEYFQLIEQNTLYLALTEYTFNQKALFINKIINEKLQDIITIIYKSELLQQVINLDQSQAIHIYFNQFQSKKQMSFEVQKIQSDKESKQLFQIQLQLQDKIEIQKILQNLQNQVAKQQFLKELIISIDQAQVQYFQNDLKNLYEDCQNSNTQLYIQIKTSYQKERLSREFFQFLSFELKLKLILNLQQINKQELQEIIQQTGIQSKIFLILCQLDLQEINDIQLFCKQKFKIKTNESPSQIYSLQNYNYQYHHFDKKLQNLIYLQKQPKDLKEKIKKNKIDIQQYHSVYRKTQIMLKDKNILQNLYLYKISFTEERGNPTIEYEKKLFQKVCIFQQNEQYSIKDFSTTLYYKASKSFEKQLQIFEQEEFNSTNHLICQLNQ
ncbi:hypothetical protein ABPG74_020210 [Tetrahymena malaccensis]